MRVRAALLLIPVALLLAFPCTLAYAKAKKYEPCSVCNPPK